VDDVDVEGPEAVRRVETGLAHGAVADCRKARELVLLIVVILADVVGADIVVLEVLWMRS
jgi:hypothetical protein